METSEDQEDSIPTRPFSLKWWQDLETKEIIYLIIFVLSILIVIALSSYVETIKDNRQFDWGVFADNYIITAIEPVVVGAILSLLDKVGVLFPVEEGVKQQILNLQKAIEEMRTSNQTLAKEMQQGYEMIGRATQDSIRKFSNYDKYRHARDVFGVSSVVGMQQRKTVFDPDVRFITTNFYIKLFEEVNAHEVLYLTSFITNIDSFEDALKSAVLRGINVKLLLMRPDGDVSIARARYEEYYGSSGTYVSFEMFISELRFSYVRLQRITSQIPSWKAINPDAGTLEIKSFDDSLNHPLIIVQEKPGASPSVAYSGFYLHEDASKMPYIEWRGGDFRMIDRFLQLFTKKWQNAREWNPPSDFFN